jgi:predicted MarR family transcription regulator
MTNPVQPRVLRALRHFDQASLLDLKETLNILNATDSRRVWSALKKLTAAGFVDRDDSTGTHRYRITAAGRDELARLQRAESVVWA